MADRQRASAPKNTSRPFTDAWAEHPVSWGRLAGAGRAIGAHAGRKDSARKRPQMGVVGLADREPRKSALRHVSVRRAMWIGKGPAPAGSGSLRPKASVVARPGGFGGAATGEVERIGGIGHEGRSGRGGKICPCIRQPPWRS